MSQKSVTGKEWECRSDLAEKVIFSLFLYYYFAEITILLIGSGLFDLFSSYQHEILLIEKYSRLLVTAVYFAVLLVRIFRQKRCAAGTVLSFLCIGMAFGSTLAAQGKNLSYDYFTKLSLLECVVAFGFIFHLGSLLSKQRLQNLIRICFKGTVFLVLFLNIISLLSLFIPHSSESIRIFGMSVSLPAVFYDPMEYRQYTRYAGFYWHPNTLGTHCCLAIVLSFYLKRQKQINPVLLFLTIGTSVFLILISRSRTGFLVLGYIALFFLYELIKAHVNDRRRQRMLFLGILVLYAVAVFFAFRTRITYFAEALLRDPYQALNSASSERLDILMEVIRMVKQSPFIGCGWNVKINGHDSAHNMFLTAAAWTGFVGLVLFIGLTGFSFISGMKHKAFHDQPWLWCLFTSILIQCQFEQGIIGDKRQAATYLFWLSAGWMAFCTGKSDNL